MNARREFLKWASLFLAAACEPLVISPVVVSPPSGFACNPQDSIALVWAGELEARGVQLVTYWYDSTGATTATGLAHGGCLAGFAADGVVGAL